MLMTGHYFFLHNQENKEQQEPLFIARCEQILSSTPNIPTNSNGSTSSTTLRFVLNEQLNINEISTKFVALSENILANRLLFFSTETLLGYRADELIDQSINRLIVSEHLHILEQARQNCSTFALLIERKISFIGFPYSHWATLYHHECLGFLYS